MLKRIDTLKILTLFKNMTSLYNRIISIIVINLLLVTLDSRTNIFGITIN